jgi:hypothetical protein
MFPLNLTSPLHRPTCDPASSRSCNSTASLGQCSLWCCAPLLPLSLLTQRAGGTVDSGSVLAQVDSFLLLQFELDLRRIDVIDSSLQRERVSVRKRDGLVQLLKV